MTLYILTRQNEEGIILSIELYQTQCEAEKAMWKSYNTEKEKLKKIGHYRDTCDYGEKVAATVGDNEMRYDWRIWIREV